MLTTIITLLTVGCFLLVNAGKMVYYNDRLPVAHAVETVPTSYYWPNEDVLPIDEPDAIHYPTWFQLPWKPIPLRQPCLNKEPDSNIPSLEVEPPLPTTTEDNTPQGRHLHHEKPHKHHHHHKHHKHHKHHHHDHDKGYKSAGIDELQDANVGQLKMVILQLEHKLQELKLQLFGGRALTNDVTNDGEDTARLDDHIDDHDATEEMEPSAEDASRVLTEIVPISETETDEGKILQQEDVKPASELELEHREIEAKPFDNGRSLEENVKKWFEGLDLGKIAALPLEESVESEDVLGTIDVRGNFQ